MNKSGIVVSALIAMTFIIMVAYVSPNVQAVSGSYSISNPDNNGAIWILNAQSGVVSRCTANGNQAPVCSKWSN